MSASRTCQSELVIGQGNAGLPVSGRLVMRVLLGVCRLNLPCQLLIIIIIVINRIVVAGSRLLTESL